MFDRVWVSCPSCGRGMEFQSKSGPCTLSDYSIGDIPPKIAADIIGDIERCENCKTAIKIEGQVVLTPVKVR
ncbi:MAG: hypothetical protein ABIC57_04175 [bacterium]